MTCFMWNVRCLAFGILRKFLTVVENVIYKPDSHQNEKNVTLLPMEQKKKESLFREIVANQKFIKLKQSAFVKHHFNYYLSYYYLECLRDTMRLVNFFFRFVFGSIRETQLMYDAKFLVRQTEA